MAKILLVEPDLLLADSYRMSLVAAGHSVIVATTAQAAICAADETCPDIVILELHLVHHNGVEFLYEFRSYSDWQDIPVLILSLAPAHEFVDSWQSLHTKLGVRAYLYKPQTSLQRLVKSIHESVR